MPGAPRRPESVLVVVYTVDAEVLLLRRSTPFDFWQSITGSLDTGEFPADAARRELHEETGLVDEGRWRDTGVSRRFDIDPRWQYRYADGVTSNLEHEWHYRLPARHPVHLNVTEHSEYCWLPLEDAVARVWSWTNREALRQLAARLT